MVNPGGLSRQPRKCASRFLTTTPLAGVEEAVTLFRGIAISGALRIIRLDLESQPPMAKRRITFWASVLVRIRHEALAVALWVSIGLVIAGLLFVLKMLEVRLSVSGVDQGFRQRIDDVSLWCLIAGVIVGFALIFAAYELRAIGKLGHSLDFSPFAALAMLVTISFMWIAYHFFFFWPLGTNPCRNRGRHTVSRQCRRRKPVAILAGREYGQPRLTHCKQGYWMSALFHLGQLDRGEWRCLIG